MNRKPAPAGADLGDGHAWLQLQLGGSVDQLVALRLFQRFMFGVAKIGAGILHLIVEEQAVEVGRDVVMVAGMSGGTPAGFALMPARRAAPHPPHQSL